MPETPRLTTRNHNRICLLRHWVAWTTQQMNFVDLASLALVPFSPAILLFLPFGRAMFTLCQYILKAYLFFVLQMFTVKRLPDLGKILLDFGFFLKDVFIRISGFFLKDVFICISEFFLRCIYLHFISECCLHVCVCICITCVLCSCGAKKGH